MKKTPGMEKFAQRWADLADRERQMVLGGGVALVALVFVFQFWLPLEAGLQQGNIAAGERAAALKWMEESAREVVRLRAAGGGIPTASGGESLLSLADRTARSQGLGEALQRVEPEGPDRVRFQFEKASFEQVLNWLAALERRYGVQAQSVTIDKEVAPGMVRARLVLTWRQG